MQRVIRPNYSTSSGTGDIQALPITECDTVSQEGRRHTQVIDTLRGHQSSNPRWLHFSKSLLGMCLITMPDFTLVPKKPRL